MKKALLLSILVIIVSCTKSNKNIDDLNSKIETENNETTADTLDFEALELEVIRDKNKKLLEACNNMDYILDSDIKDDILTIKVNSASKKEAQLIAEGMLDEIKIYNNHINTVIVINIKYDILGYAGK